MPFKSAEIRWFSDEKETLWRLYENLGKPGEGTREAERTDYYLKSGTISTGVKIREGNHELKVKCAEDEDLDYGVMEHWIKWSTPKEKNILNTIDDSFLGDWIAVKKKRFRKSYKIVGGKKPELIKDEFAAEGCDIEFTGIYLQKLDQPIYTFGLEAFSSKHQERKNLLVSLENLDIDFSQLRELDSYGYAQLLHGIGNRPG